MKTHVTIDKQVLEMALVGFEAERDRIDAAITELRSSLNNISSGRDTAKPTSSLTTTRRKPFSAASRKRMALAQKKRWKALKTQQAESAQVKRKPAKRVVASKKVAVKRPKVASKTNVVQAAPQAQVAEQASVVATA